MGLTLEAGVVWDGCAGDAWNVLKHNIQSKINILPKKKQGINNGPSLGTSWFACPRLLAPCLDQENKARGEDKIKALIKALRTENKLEVIEAAFLQPLLAANLLIFVQDVGGSSLGSFAKMTLTGSVRFVRQKFRFLLNKVGS